ncbi:hypothetical protein CVH10_04770 [Halomonas sp. ND22Bw]|uniref:Uncharacterized protein n=1 Tax=Halomonas salina TaxID=42565 RepID=A0ABR4WSG0_9GAMM|nr:MULTISPECIES: hypothetical protein [Halomonas]KGE77380.1 hypothetical protein FP66_10305 [Halomonas salina]PSJ23195.1 hypothetical protein CVH10_04770 [Halomonas sp. ND22Bw]RAH37905.1 hypothetical protein C9J49_008010 [Halomonas sp. SL1]
MPEHSADRIAFRYLCLRGFGYMLLIAALLEIVLFEATHMPDLRFTERGLTEPLQSLLLLTGTIMALIARRLDDRLPHLTLLLIGLLGASLIREQDAWLDEYVFDGAWQILVSLLVLPILFVVIRHGRAFAAELERYAMTFSGGLFAAGFLGTYVFSRLYGRGDMWKAVLGEHYVRVFKDAAEEVTELFGYTLMCIAMIELLLLARRWRRQRLA